MSVHLLRLDPKPFEAARWFAAEALDPRGGEDDGYRWHALLAAVFGKEAAPKPFRVLAPRGRPPQVLAYAGGDPAELETRARAFADPLALAAVGLDAGTRLAAKPMPSFTAGARLHVSARLRPTVRTDRDGDRTRSAEIDAYVDALRAADATAAPRPDRASVYRAFAARKLEGAGLRIGDLRLDGLDRVRVARRDASRDLRLVEGYAVHVEAAAEVVDGDAFARALAHGIGRHRAFGYGMLLLAPA